LTGTVNPTDVTDVVRRPALGGHIPPQLTGLSGIELLRAMLARQFDWPPIHYLTGMRFTEIGSGTAAFTMPITDWLKTPQGIVTGGEVAILADGPLGCAVHSVLPAGVGYTTTELTISMVRPVPSTGHLVGRGTLVHGGRQLSLSEVHVTDSSGRLIAHGTSRCLLIPLPGDPPPPPSPSAAVGAPLGEEPPGPYEGPAFGAVLDDEIWATRSGLEVMDALITGALPPPPVSYLLGATPVDASEGRCVFQMPATEWLTSPLGTVEGGVTSCLADLAMASAVQTTLAAGTAYAPYDLRVQFLRPVPADGRTLIATGTVVSRGRTVATTRAEVTNADGKLVATATGAAVILPGRRPDLRELAQLA